MKTLSLALAVALLAPGAFARSSAPEWLKSVALMAPSTYPAKTPGVVLLDETSTTVGTQGEVRTRHRRAYRILNTDGRDLGYVAVHFDSDTKLTDFRAWGITAAGEEYQVKERDALEKSAFDGELYADHKVKILHIPASDPGNVIGYEYEQVARQWGLQDVWEFQSHIPLVRARYSLALPPNWSHQTRWFNASPALPQSTANQTVWEVTNVPGIEDEPGMPARRSLAGRMAVHFIPPPGLLDGRSHRTWDDVARWYGALSAPRRTPTPQLLAKARELVSNLQDPMDRLRALTRFSQHDVRYVAIEIGIGGWQPHAAHDVFTNRYGDCKDKVTVLAAMLREIGLESHYVLVNTRRGLVDQDFATHLAFNHAIIAIRLPAGFPASGLHATVNHPKAGKILLFDPTNTNTPLGLLPVDLQQSRALLVLGDGGELIDLPMHGAEANRLARQARMKLDRSGALDGEISELRTGSIAASYRDAMQPLTVPERQQFVERMLSYHLAQFSLRDLAIENLDDPSKDLVIRYRLNAPGYGKRAAEMLLLRPRLVGRKPEAILDLAQRKHDYETSGPSLETDDIQIAIPAGLVADELPPAQKLEIGVVSYASESTFEADTLRYRRSFKVDRFLVPRPLLADLNKAFNQILADERSSAVLLFK